MLTARNELGLYIKQSALRLEKIKLHCLLESVICFILRCRSSTVSASSKLEGTGVKCTEREQVAGNMIGVIDVTAV